jgi:hypothetical protein
MGNITLAAKSFFEDIGIPCVPPENNKTALQAGARVSPDDHASGSGPERRRLSDPLDEVGGQRLADDPANAVRPEVAARHRGRR